MNFDGTGKKLLKGSHDLWERNRKIIYHKICQSLLKIVRILTLDFF